MRTVACSSAWRECDQQCGRVRLQRPAFAPLPWPPDPAALRQMHGVQSGWLCSGGPDLERLQAFSAGQVGDVLQAALLHQHAHQRLRHAPCIQACVVVLCFLALWHSGLDTTPVESGIRAWTPRPYILEVLKFRGPGWPLRRTAPCPLLDAG